MAFPKISERGAEAVQLAFALPLLVLAFIATAQIMIWTFSAVQFSSAGESVAYAIDLNDLQEAGTSTTAARTMVAQAISERLIGHDSEDVSVLSVSVEGGATKISPLNAEAGTLASGTYLYSTSQTTGTVSFTATYACPSIINLGSPLVIERTWTRSRLLSRRAEVSG